MHIFYARTHITGNPAGNECRYWKCGEPSMSLGTSGPHTIDLVGVEFVHRIQVQEEFQSGGYDAALVDPQRKSKRYQRSLQIVILVQAQSLRITERSRSGSSFFDQDDDCLGEVLMAAFTKRIHFTPSPLDCLACCWNHVNTHRRPRGAHKVPRAAWHR